jgi:branched-chain amino acid aminotransferase
MTVLGLWRISNNNVTPRLKEIEMTCNSSLDECSLNIPAGAYTTFRTYKHWHALHLEDHFRRLEETSQLINGKQLLDGPSIRIVLKQLLQQFDDIPELRVRLTLDLVKFPGDLYIMMEPLHVPSSDLYLNGVKTITTALSRSNPKAKATSFIEKTAELRSKLPEGINESLMVNQQGYILEGLSSNFFAIKNGEIWTNDRDVLSGITRQIVLDEALAENLVIHYESIQTSDIAGLNEAFITSSSRAVLPVVKIDETIIGAGKPGELSLLLLDRYTKRVEKEIQHI